MIEFLFIYLTGKGSMVIAHVCVSLSFLVPLQNWPAIMQAGRITSNEMNTVLMFSEFA